MHCHHQPVSGHPALPFDLPALIQGGQRPAARGAVVGAGGHPGEGAEFIDDQHPLRDAPGHAARSPTAMLTPSMDRKNSSSAHIIASMLVWIRMPSTLGEHVGAGFPGDIGPAFGVDNVDQPAVRASVRSRNGCGGGLAAAGPGHDEQVRLLMLQIGDPLSAPGRVARWTRCAGW